MVKFRGIEVCVISQFDICKLPEFQYQQTNYPPPSLGADPFIQVDHNQYRNNVEEGQAQGQVQALCCPTASCYIPIYPGSQIWFEYTVDGPHPPGAAYFFKLFVNGKAVAAWDCTARHGFHGKMMYNLVVENDGTLVEDGGVGVRRQSLRFGNGRAGSGSEQDIIEVNVHRIEHRRRVRNLPPGLGAVEVGGNHTEGLRLADGGLLESGLRPRRYQYQLLDPIDMPYAAFRFYCRSYGEQSLLKHNNHSSPSPAYLENYGIIRLPNHTSPCTSPNSTVSQASVQDSMSSPGNHNPHTAESTGSPLPSSPPQPAVIPSPALVANEPAKGHANSPIQALGKAAHIPISDSDDSLSVRTKDSIEELPSSVPWSPKSSRPAEKKAPDGCRQLDPEMPASPTRSPKSARQRLKKKLTVTINGAEFDIERKKRPLSPFTSGGVLRKASMPQTAPPALTEFGPTVEDEVREQMSREIRHVEAKPVYRTTSAERGGSKLMGFLSRRIREREKSG
ncbi:hypothetical protein HRR83_004225 [Exophiala dermatitidis]|uniref:Uncharacterized protein n=1 Tax=Exophiala dermatitidis TaxID=5970 RepID=A0AAN6ESY5_EXODE|nr:hypothetical protein HRR73_006312 [Exophiala dermatitidis]KAJ4517801.1 hypothetical protein HRR75_003020 [Exophiala dermatitidis]KAJ4521469.1 hypothetical protein HRR74_003293 [Exophiala dermatitidis]KAJ4552074.1 hypothetical protein HRR78_003641 [Exophiala dermatitidis]KAJ4565383.1 hypothetical protein HRR79_005646 [Exophiala dermatitidis]